VVDRQHARPVQPDLVLAHDDVEGIAVIVMPANNSAALIHFLAGKYPGLLGHLYSPGGQFGPYTWLSYGLDNGAYGAFTTGRPWDVGAWHDLLAWAKESGQPPRWTLVPDVVGDRAATLRMWDQHAATAAAFGWPLAFAAQDGMEPADVPAEAQVVFVGGSTEWKWSTLSTWCAAFPRVHVGRVNTYRWVRVAEDAGAESCDGTGWMRGRKEQLRGLLQWLSEASGESARATQTSLFCDDSDELTEAGSKSARTEGPAPCGAAKPTSLTTVDVLEAPHAD
jgi:hypothetical protein